ncbi:hypothetical protein AB4865_05220 [Capnocytophaga sp. ARDL2]|uniref:hypothetical protein n=1 Tax=Capnocytophaga sp. ARDL2 TaxID=3238809 RepID=UPI00355903D5
MKKFVSHLMIATMVIGTLASCGRDDDYSKSTEPKKESITPLKKFTLEKTEITIKRGKTDRIKIISGNGDYDYTQNLQIAIINLSKDKEYLEITALKEGGRASTYITDTKSGKSINIIVNTTN